MRQTRDMACDNRAMAYQVDGDFALFRRLFRGREDAKAFMQSCRELGIPAELEDAILRASGGRHPLDVAFVFLCQN